MENALAEIGFSGETGERSLILAHLVAERLECHRPMLGMGGTVHHRRTTFADQLFNRVAGYVLSDEVFLSHGREPNATVGERQAISARCTRKVYDAQE